jgi:uncharacterized membrane protein YeaQ/YmgE (transglycosylase-associated protein family)
MDLVLTLVIGGLVGWTASLLLGNDPRRGVLASGVVGVVGSVLGTGLARRLGIPPAGAAERWLVSLTGAVLLVAIVRALGSRRPRGRGQDRRSSWPASRASWASAAFFTSMWRLSRTSVSR